MFAKIQEISQALQAGKIILYPTDTVWGLGCDATNSTAIQKIYAIKQREESKALITLVRDVQQIQHYIPVLPLPLMDALKESERPTTVIYPNAQDLPSNLVAQDGSLAMRIPKHDFCQQLLTAFGKPIVSTSANISGEPTPMQFADISVSIKEMVDYIVPYEQDVVKPNIRPSRILKLEAGEIIVIRE